LSEQSAWKTWKPYAIIGAIAVGGFWWYSTQSSIATLKDGAYVCQGVYVNESGKYEILTKDDGSRYEGSATVREGDVVTLAGDSAMSASQIASLTLRSSGTSHFHVTDDPAVKMYNAVACDFVG
jgi:hypothetical protein